MTIAIQNRRKAEQDRRILYAAGVRLMKERDDAQKALALEQRLRTEDRSALLFQFAIERDRLCALLAAADREAKEAADARLEAVAFCGQLREERDIARKRVEILEEEDRQWELHGVTQIYKERDDLREELATARTTLDLWRTLFGMPVKGA